MKREKLQRANNAGRQKKRAVLPGQGSQHRASTCAHPGRLRWPGRVGQPVLGLERRLAGVTASRLALRKGRNLGLPHRCPQDLRLPLRGVSPGGHPTAPGPRVAGAGGGGGNSCRLSPKGAAAGRELAEGEFAPSHGLWEPVSEPGTSAMVAERDGIPSHLGKQERKSAETPGSCRHSVIQA